MNEQELILRVRRETKAKVMVWEQKAREQNQANRIMHAQLAQAVAMLETVTHVSCGFAWDAGIRIAELERELEAYRERDREVLDYNGGL